MWCPKCKNEYREGITVCADCGCELVESLTVCAACNEKNSVFPKPENEPENEMKKPIDSEMGSEMASETEQAVYENNANEELSSPEASERSAPAYIPKRSRYEDNKSSAFTFLLIGGVGAILVILHIAGVLDFNLTAFSKILTNTVMGALFIIFIVVGIVSTRNASRYKKEAAAEEALTGQICSFFHELYTTEGIDNACGITEDSSTYEKWDLRYHFIEKQISDEYSELAADYLEYITELIYNDIYSE